MNRAESNSWRRVKLKEVCEKITVGHVGPMVNEYVDSGVPFLRSQNIQPFKLDIAEMKHITPEFHKKLSKSALHPGDVAIVRTGYPGTAAVIPKRFTELNCADLVIARPTSHLLDPWYLTCIFNSTWGRGAVAGNLVGVAQQHFNVTAAKEMEVLLPDLPTQRRIASILSAYDDLIENNTRRIAILEEMARRIYEEWFVHFRFPGHEQVNMLESEMGLIPEGWKVISLGEVSAINAKSIRPANAPEEILYIDIASVVTGAITQKQPYRFSEAPGRARRVVQNGDIIWSCVRPNRRSYALVLQPEPALIASTGFAVLSAKSVPYSYLYFAVTTNDFVGFLTNHATGAAYPAVSATTFESAQILMPQAEVADYFHSIAAPMLDLSETLKRKNANLRATRDLLLPKLISGELDVSSLPEPEEVITA